MKCVICHGNEIELMEVKEQFTVGNDIVYVPIKVPVCKIVANDTMIDVPCSY